MSGAVPSDKTVVTLMGSRPTDAPAGAASAAAAVAPVQFVEDMSAAQRAEAGEQLPAGLVNMGNTCYMNATVQALRAVPELRTALAAGAASSTLANKLNTTLTMLDGSTEAVTPMQLLSTVHAQFPQFGEPDRMGRFKQQDAEEFLAAVMSNLAHGSGSSSSELARAIPKLFGVKLALTDTCAESGETTTSEDSALKLVCNIEGGAGSASAVNHLADGLRLGMSGSIEKFSPALERNAVWERQGRIAQLPKYLCTQFMRFYWKATPDSSDHAGIKCKLLRAVNFPADKLDMFPFATPELQAALKPAREAEEAETAAQVASAGANVATPGVKRASPSHDAGDVPEEDMDDELAAAIAMSLQGDGAAEAVASSGTTAATASGLLSGFPPKFKGYYELFAVVTHKGRSADSGHYMGWVRSQGDKWHVFDDDEVSPCDTEDVLALRGGGDHHTAYLAFYRAKE